MSDRATVEVVILVASAGGLDALCTVLETLPSDYPAAIVVQQHLRGPTSVLASILARRTHRDVCWAVDGRRIRPGQVSVCPPDVCMELTPDGRCAMRTMGPVKEPRCDVLLTSAAASYGPRALAVVLSGSGHDGAEGAAAIKRAGGTLIVQGYDAAFSSMPTAAARAGADAVLSAPAIGTVLKAIGRRGLDRAGGVRALLDELGIENHTADVHDDHSDTYESASARGDAAGRRVAELRRRREELAAGSGATAQSAATASARAVEAARRASVACEAAARRIGALRT